MNPNSFITAAVLLAFVLLNACSQTTPETLKGPVAITTKEAFSIGINRAECGGSISYDGGSAIRERGLCWNLQPQPEVDSFQTAILGNGKGDFSGSIQNLKSNTRYFARAWARNESGISYGNQVQFTTSGIDSLICKRVREEGILLSGEEVISATNLIPYYSVASGSFDEIRINSFGIKGLTGRISTGNLAQDSGMLMMSIEGIPEKAGTAYFQLELGGKKCLISRMVSITDVEKNRYSTVNIGEQVWMKENLRTSRYRNGDPIPGSLSNSEWSGIGTGAFGIQESLGSQDSLHGKLYNWFAVTDPRGLCPEGFHVPDDAEWSKLENTLSGPNFAGGLLKSTGTIQAGNGLWENPNASAGNQSNFTAHPGGYRNIAGEYKSLGSYAYWWTATENSDDFAWYRSLVYLNGQSNRYVNQKQNGMSVRCLQD